VSLAKKLLAIGVCLALLMAAVLIVLAALDLPKADQLSSVCGGILALYAFVSGAVVVIGRGRRPSQPTEERLDAAARALADAVQNQWEAEATRRGVRGVPLADMRWTIDGCEAGGEASLADRVVQAWHEHEGQWLYVQGGPGSGKSTFAILLMLQLLQERTTHDTPVPVLLSAAGWNPSNPFTDWVAGRLRDTYPFLEQREMYGDRAADCLVKSPRLLVILDGLDELVENRQAGAAAAGRRARGTASGPGAAAAVPFGGGCDGTVPRGRRRGRRRPAGSVRHRGPTENRGGHPVVQVTDTTACAGACTVAVG
jgi:hypothetical protein